MRKKILYTGIIICWIAALFILKNFICISRIDSGGYSIINRAGSFNRGDSIVFNFSEDNGETVRTITSRIIGFPGDTIKISNGTLFINDKEYIEDYIRGNNNADFQTYVSDGQCLVINDNRTDLNGNNVLLVNEEQIIGKEMLNILNKSNKVQADTTETAETAATDNITEGASESE